MIDSRTEILLEEARRFVPTAEYGDDHGRKYTAQFRPNCGSNRQTGDFAAVREAERDHLFDEFAGREGEINGTVQNISGGNITIGLVVPAIPPQPIGTGERYRHQ